MIVPEGEVLRALKQDYIEASGMFGGEGVSFRDILATLREVEERLGREVMAGPE